MSKLIIAAVLGQFVGLLGWLDPLFIPLVLAGPLVSGAYAATKRLPAVWPAVLWLSAGVNMLWTDWVVNREDVLFHVVVAGVMVVLTLIGWGGVRMATRGKVVASPPSDSDVQLLS